MRPQTPYPALASSSPHCHYSGICLFLRWESELEVCCVASCSSIPDTKHTSHLQDTPVSLLLLSIRVSPAPAWLFSLSFKRSFMFALLILTRLLFLRPIIGKSQLLLNSFSGKSVPAALCCYSQEPMCFSARSSHLSLPSSPSLRSFAGSICCWGCKCFRWVVQYTVMIQIFGVSFLLQVVVWLEAWERVGAERALYHMWNKETAGSYCSNYTTAFFWSMKMGSGAILWSLISS